MTTTTTIKSIKSMVYAFFQPQNAFLIQKSMRHVDVESSSTGYDEHQLQPQDYQLRRAKNNESVRKSRAKNRVKLQECAEHVAELRAENAQLNSRLDGLRSELFTLKGLFQHCFSFNLNSLAIKPSEIPTATLYKVIMKKELEAAPGATTATADVLGSLTPSSSSSDECSQPSPASSLFYTDTDNFYISKIKGALASIVASSSSSSSSSNGSAPSTPAAISQLDEVSNSVEIVMKEHDYTSMRMLQPIN